MSLELPTKQFPWGLVELLPYAGGWLWRCPDIGFHAYSSLDYRTKEMAFEAAERRHMKKGKPEGD